jgi:uncharacterized protein YndB with AHSA1/START domain
MREFNGSPAARHGTSVEHPMHDDRGMTAQAIPHTAVPNTARVRRELSSPPERVFDAFLDPGCVRRWFGGDVGTVDRVELDPRVGGRFSIGLQRSTGEAFETSGVYRELDRPRRLAFTWATSTGGPVEGLVIVDIAREEAGSAVTLTHRLDRGFKGRRLDVEVGWQHMLDAMADALGGSTVEQMPLPS